EERFRKERIPTEPSDQMLPLLEREAESPLRVLRPHFLARAAPDAHRGSELGNRSRPAAVAASARGAFRGSRLFGTGGSTLVVGRNHASSHACARLRS